MVMAGSDAFRTFEHAGWGKDTVALAYHRHLGEVTSGCIPKLLEAAGVKAGDKVLDVACGAGYVAASARDRGAVAIGLDFSAVQVRLAEQTYPGIRFIEGDAEALPFPDREFDAVVNAFGLPHIPDPDKATAEAHRVPAGRPVRLRLVVRACEMRRLLDGLRRDTGARLARRGAAARTRLLRLRPAGRGPGDARAGGVRRRAGRLARSAQVKPRCRRRAGREPVPRSSAPARAIRNSRKRLLLFRPGTVIAGASPLTATQSVAGQAAPPRATASLAAMRSPNLRSRRTFAGFLPADRAWQPSPCTSAPARALHVRRWGQSTRWRSARTDSPSAGNLQQVGIVHPPRGLAVTLNLPQNLRAGPWGRAELF